MADPAKPVTVQEAAKAVRHVAKQAQKVSESAAHLETSAGAVERSVDLQTETAIRRTVLAGDRTVLAADRTYAAWTRTGLAALASGVGAHALFGPSLPRWLVMLVAVVLVGFALFCFGAASWRQTRGARPDPRPETARIPPVVTLGFSVLLSLVGLAALAEIILGAGAH